MNLFTDVGIHKNARNQLKIDIAFLVCELQTYFPNNPMINSQNVAELSMLTSKIDHQNLKTITKTLAILQNSL